jgi:hypothetical protein
MRPFAAAVSAAVTSLVVTMLLTGEAGSSAPPPGAGSDRLEVYLVDVEPNEVELLAAAGVDTTHLPALTDGGQVEIVATSRQAKSLREQGLSVRMKRIHGVKASTVAAQRLAAGQAVFRQYSGPDGIADELRQVAAQHRGLTKLVTIGTSTNGQPILALKVTRKARTTKDGKRPSVLYLGAQHAREWITPEMVRRLLHHVLDSYGSDPTITKLLKGTELWFVPVANPDGYDFTFSTERFWRKTLRDNDGDGQITSVDGVDPNRNYPTKWGWDDEGSSPDPADETYRGPSPASEPETRAVMGLLDRVRFEFVVNYHSAAELLLYGVGWQVSTPSPDDLLYEAMAGDDADPAVPGYDPDISAELYTVNGETLMHATEHNGTLGFTPEMSTCQTASDSNPDDEWLAENCLMVFDFPDDETLIQAEYAKNLPFALAVARSAADPDDPVSVVGRTVPDLVPDAFADSYGTTHRVAVTAKRALSDTRLRYSVNGGPTRTASVSEWNGGERYGDSYDRYLAEYRGTVTGTAPGDSVRVWFTAKRGKTTVTSPDFTYHVATDIGGDVLILAAEDTTGISPVQGATSAKYAASYAADLTAAGYTSDVYDVDTHGRRAPHHLGVLSHYDAVVWETGDDIIPRSTGQVGGTAAKLALDLELSVRDYLNEGGKALVTGKYNQYAQGADGSYWYEPFPPPECTTPNAYPCLPLLNDFQQYWLGAYDYLDGSGTDENGDPVPLLGDAGGFAGFEATLNGAQSAGNQDHTAAFLTTSSFLPPDAFPQFTSEAPVDWVDGIPSRFNPYSGDWLVQSRQADESWKRLTRTIDLTGATSGSLSFQTSFEVESDYDFVLVEAHTVGADNWTTLPDANGNTTTSTGSSCTDGWVDLHPFVAHYQGADCSPTGTTGTWNAATGDSGGWQEWDIDLTPYAGQQVEVSISYVSDWFVQERGVSLDDVQVLANGAPVSATSFEDGFGGWTVAPPPAGSSQANSYVRSDAVYSEGAVVTTDDTVFTGFGVEGMSDPATRQDFLSRALTHLLN